MSRIIEAFKQFFDNSGNVLSSGKVYFYESGSVAVAKATYSDNNQTIANTNPVILDGAGRIGNVFGTGAYKAVLTDSNDIQIEVFDPISEVGSSASFSEWVFDISYSSGVYVAYNGQTYKSNANGNLGNQPDISPAFWTPIADIETWSSAKTYSAGDSVLGDDGYIYKSVLGGENFPPSSNPNYWECASSNQRQARLGRDNQRSVTSGDGLLFTIINESAKVKTSLFGGLELNLVSDTTNTGDVSIDLANVIEGTPLTLKSLLMPSGAEVPVGLIPSDGRPFKVIYSSVTDQCYLMTDNFVKGVKIPIRYLTGSSAEIEVLDLPSVESFEIELTFIGAGSATFSGRIQVSTNNGTTYSTTSYSGMIDNKSSSGVNALDTYNATGTGMYFTGNSAGVYVNDSSGYYSGTMKLSGMNNAGRIATLNHRSCYQPTDSATILDSVGSSRSFTIGDYDSFKFVASGSFVNYEIVVYVIV